jgi:hypothetical protein
MTQTNIEGPMLLNSSIVKNNLIEINSKVLHLLLPSVSNFKTIKEINFHPHRMMAQSLKHMVKCFKEDLIKNPIFFSLIKISTLDQSFIERFENNKTIPNEELEIYKKNYDKSLDFLCYLLSNKVDSLEFGKKLWDLQEYKN